MQGGVKTGRRLFNRPAATAERFVPHPFSSKRATGWGRKGRFLAGSVRTASWSFGGCRSTGQDPRQPESNLLEVEAGTGRCRTCSKPRSRASDRGETQLIAYAASSAGVGPMVRECETDWQATAIVHGPVFVTSTISGTPNGK